MRDNGKIYAVKTVTLNDLLAQQNCPKQIDYLSIDTEGAELSILEAFSFNDYNISIITVETYGIKIQIAQELKTYFHRVIFPGSSLSFPILMIGMCIQVSLV